MSVVLLSFAFFQVWPIVSWNSESVQISGRYRDACFWVRKRATNKQAKRQRDRNVGMHADRQIDRQTVGQTGRQARRQEDRQTILSQIMHSVYALFQTFVFFSSRFRWSRQQAVDFMAENTAISLHSVNTEVDRYIIWPGQVGGCLSLPYFEQFMLSVEDVEIPHATLNVALGCWRNGRNWLLDISVILSSFLA